MNQSSNKLRRLAFSKITVLCLTAALIAAFSVSIANDLYGFVGSDEEVFLTIEEPTGLSELARMLEQNGIVDNPTFFRLYVQRQNCAERLEGFVGTLQLDTSMSYRELLLAFSQ